MNRYTIKTRLQNAYSAVECITTEILQKAFVESEARLLDIEVSDILRELSTTLQHVEEGYKE